MHNTGSIDSIANVIFLAADERYAAAHSSFLFHGITWTYGTNAAQTKNQVSETLSNINSAETKIKNIIKERTTISSEDVDELFSQGEVKNPDYAKENKIISAIKDPAIPKGARLFTFNLQ